MSKFQKWRSGHRYQKLVQNYKECTIPPFQRWLWLRTLNFYSLDGQTILPPPARRCSGTWHWQPGNPRSCSGESDCRVSNKLRFCICVRFYFGFSLASHRPLFGLRQRPYKPSPSMLGNPAFAGWQWWPGNPSLEPPVLPHTCTCVR